MKKEQQQLPKFELIETYNEETAKGYELQAKHRQAVAEAQALVTALNYRYEEAVKEAVINNIDNAALINDLSEQLEKAERDLTNRKRMQQVAAAVNKRTVTQQEIKNGLGVYQNEYQSEVIAPALKELRKAKEAYISEYLDVMRKIEHFDQQVKAAYYAINPTAISVPYSVGFRTQQNINHKCVTSVDLHELARGQKPSSLQPMTKAVTGQDGVTRFLPINEEGENN